MSRRRHHKIWVRSKKLKRIMKELNNNLREDCYAGRFEVRKVDERHLMSSNWFNGRPKTITINEWGDSQWLRSMYKLEFIDHEDPSRTTSGWFEWSTDQFALRHISSPFEQDHLTGDYLNWAVNNFIIESDFWDKWKDLEYQKTHWYSGNELKMMMMFDESFATPEERWRKKHD